ncbi:MAG: LacI family DNA-binding transcriptional regulator [Clostridia bacterium]
MTIREIATLAGVSPAAVSLVLHQKKGIGEDTRQRVQAVIDEMGYMGGQKRKAKRFRIALIKYTTHGIAVEENQGFIASIIDRIEIECRRCAFDMVMCSCQAKTAAEIIRELMLDPPNGVIFIGTELSAEDCSLLDLITVPVLVLDNHIECLGRDSLVMANAFITANAVEYLYELGHRDIGYYQFKLPIHNCQERYQGYLQQMERLGLTPPTPLRMMPTLKGSYEDMLRLIKEEGYVPHGAVVADNDTVAIGAMKAIREAGYRIPEDVSIVGVDDSPFSAVTMPALTTMRISRSTLASLAVDMLRNRLEHPEWPNMHMQITGKLVVRKSTKKVEILTEENDNHQTC